jgi:hypothetical protein
MSCASAGYTGRQATDAIVGRLTGREIANTKLVYPGNHISLGRRDGILQPVDEEAQAKPMYVGGRKAARIKTGILKISLWGISHPTFALPARKRRLAATPGPRDEPVTNQTLLMVSYRSPRGGGCAAVTTLRGQGDHS